MSAAVCVQFFEGAPRELTIISSLAKRLFAHSAYVHKLMIVTGSMCLPLPCPCPCPLPPRCLPACLPACLLVLQCNAQR
jgi:hypothetical protein